MGTNSEQPAELVIVSAYILHNVHLLMTSGIGTRYDPATGEGTLGKNYCYQLTPSVDIFFDDKILNPFVGAGALGMIVDDWNGDNFDHTGLGFIHGGYIAGYMTTGRPIETELIPEGTPKWGAEWKRAFVKNYLILDVHIPDGRGDAKQAPIISTSTRPTAMSMADR
ncbi:hypothetical protein ACVOMV_17135 [Mesorhizobium atlanticum]